MSGGPNAFVSIRVRAPPVKDAVRSLQEEMLRVQPGLGPTMTPLVKLHLTLMVLKLDSKAQEQRAKAILADITQSLRRDKVLDDTPLRLEFGGIGNFGDNIVFVKVKESPAKDKLHEIADIVRAGFSQGGLPPTDTRPFQSHLTVAKVTKSLKKRLQNGIPPHTYATFLDSVFGEQVVEGLELLSMSKPVDEEGYYHCFTKCPFPFPAQ